MQGTAARILVVDDDAPVRKLLQEMVKSLGYSVMAAGNGATALEMAEAEPPDGVLLDIAMPGMNGIEVCRRLRAQRQTATVPILLVTADIDLQTRVAAFEAGADDYVNKPFETRELQARLRAHLELAKYRAEIALMKGVLATIRMMAHEFNNPLQAVVGGLHLLRSANEGGPVTHEDALEMIADGTNTLSDLAHRIVRITEPSFKESPIGTMLDIESSR